MITSFADQGSADIWEGVDTRAARGVLPKQLWPKAQVLMDRLHAARQPGDLRVPPSNNLEKLKGDLAGFWSVRINQQYRLIFRFEGGNAEAVQVVDYH